MIKNLWNCLTLATRQLNLKVLEGRVDRFVLECLYFPKPHFVQHNITVLRRSQSFYSHVRILPFPGPAGFKTYMKVTVSYHLNRLSREKLIIRLFDSEIRLGEPSHSTLPFPDSSILQTSLQCFSRWRSGI